MMAEQIKAFSSLKCSLFATAASLFDVFSGTGRLRWILGSDPCRSCFVHVLHLEDNLEGRVEHFIEALLLLG